ncbi:MAG: CBS domain-containing protein [Candidatus Omnitrophica bacterium]|nr:CBS domain-containing protein [Candidatus Omnitrophota bacterium]MBU1127912.1 CBS domain-containing protein [Candidatus Omnitrophota bacterium]MBU1784596.1 CBS domain-containing protein [Candidatus Omnitrophota bacterium]MBU1850909.1 CBS domain-containing protein [Candidatus Omnitrophota bacterium]
MKDAKLKKLSTRLSSIKAKDIMTKDVIVTAPETHLADIAELMIKKRISGLPVVDKEGDVAGTITANDLFLVMDMIRSGDIVEGEKLSISEPTVRFAMSAGAIVINTMTTLEEIIAIMKYRNAHTLPVFDGRKMVGVVGRRDIFKNFYAVVKEIY